MITHKKTKLKKLFDVLGSGKVVTASFLNEIGISKDLKKYYLESAWLESIGRGAYKKPGDTIEWQGALCAVQKQTDLNVHVGGLSALSLQGFSHYIRQNNERIWLYSPHKSDLPKWFKNYFEHIDIEHTKTSFIKGNIALKEIEVKQNQIIVSMPERAIMECLYMSPQRIDLVECYQILEGLVNLRPNLVLELLENCNSIKVKRLFLYMAEKANLSWFNFVDTEKINLGRGSRLIVENGMFVSKYLITVPKEFKNL